jgi:hypothetical protein
MKTHNIRLLPAGEPHTPVRRGGWIRWTNDSGVDITSLELPSCIDRRKSPPGRIPHGGKTGEYRVKRTAPKGRYDYKWTDASCRLGTRTGTIDVN